MLHVILYEPEIPPNTGNIIRLCANTGAHLHLVHPLGFDLSERRMRRAGLDYHEYADVTEHQSLDECLAAVAPANVYAFSTRGQRPHTDPVYTTGDALISDRDTRLATVITRQPADVTGLAVTYAPNNRSLNLANTVAVVVYGAWRQLGFAGAG